MQFPAFIYEKYFENICIILFDFEIFSSILLGSKLAAANVYMCRCSKVILKALTYCYTIQETNGFFQFEIIINVVVSSFLFI